MAGAGTHLHRMIQWHFDENVLTGCKCELWIRKMDRKPHWAETHKALIVSKLRKTAIERGWNLAVKIPGHRFPLWGMVIISINRAKRDAGRQSQHAPGRAA